MIFEGFPWHYSIHFNWTANYTGNKTREVKCQDSYWTSMYHTYLCIIQVCMYFNSTFQKLKYYVVHSFWKTQSERSERTHHNVSPTFIFKNLNFIIFKMYFFFHLFNAFRNEELKNRIFLLWTSNFWTQVKLQGTFPTILMAPSMWSLITFCY